MQKLPTLPDLKAEITSIKDFHYLVLPVLNPKLEQLDRFEVPDFHWDLYKSFSELHRLKLDVAPVGFAKSTILKLWGLKEFLDQIDPYVLYVSSTFTKATDQFGGVKKILEQGFLQLIYKYKVVTSNETEIVIEFGSKRRQKFQAIASGADILGINFEGIRPSLILIDDLEELEQAKSTDRTNKLQEWLYTVLISRLPSLSEGRVRMINTVLTRDSLTNRILGRAPNLDKGSFRDWSISFYQALKNNKSIWEEVHPTKALLEEKKLRPHIFASNYMNEPLDLSDSKIKYEDLRFYQGYNLGDFTSLYIHADTTHTGNDTSDYFSCGVLGESWVNKNYYLLDFVLEKLDVESQARKVIEMYMAYPNKITRITYDEKANNGFGFWVKKLAKEEYGISLPLRDLKYPNDKVTHFEPHQPHFLANRVYLPKEHKDISIAVTQLISFPSKNVNDDFVDMMSGLLDNFQSIKAPIVEKNGIKVTQVRLSDLEEEMK